jgi:hypothetical protein
MGNHSVKHAYRNVPYTTYDATKNGIVTRNIENFIEISFWPDGFS